MGFNGATLAVTGVRLYFSPDGSNPTPDVAVSLHDDSINLSTRYATAHYLHTHPDFGTDPAFTSMVLGTTLGAEDPEELMVPAQKGYVAAEKILVQSNVSPFTIAEVEVLFTELGEERVCQCLLWF